MQFNKLIQSFLKENTTHLLEGEQASSKIPVFDGKREMYEIFIYPTDISDVLRVSEYDANLFDDEYALEDYGAEMLYRGSNMQQALHSLNERYILHFDTDLPDNVPNQIEDKLGHLTGTWFVLDDMGNSCSLTIGIDIDLGSERAKQIQCTFKDVDTSGLEDIL